VWDATLNLTKAESVWLSGFSAISTTINGVAGIWIRLRIASGTGAPTVSKIQWSIENGISNWLMSEKYELDLTVRDTAGAAIVGASVVITDSDGVVQYSGVTGAGGVMPMQTLTSAKWWFDPLDPASSGSPQYIVEKVYGAYTVTVSKAGYRTSVTKGVIASKTAWVVALEANLGHSAVM